MLSKSPSLLFPAFPLSSSFSPLSLSISLSSFLSLWLAAFAIVDCLIYYCCSYLSWPNLSNAHYSLPWISLFYSTHSTSHLSLIFSRMGFSFPFGLLYGETKLFPLLFSSGLGLRSLAGSCMEKRSSFHFSLSLQVGVLVPLWAPVWGSETLPVLFLFSFSLEGMSKVALLRNPVLGQGG